MRFSIYLIENKSSGRMYIGYAQNISVRWYQHAKKSSSKELREDIRIRGIDNFSFTVIDGAETLYVIREKEVYWILHFKTFHPHGYNIAINGGHQKLLNRDDEYLKNVRLSIFEKKLKKRDIAKEMGISDGHLVNLLNGRDTLSEDKKALLNKVLKTNF